MMIACAVVTSALSGMRSSELLELEVGCRTPARTVAGGGCRFRLSGKAIKNKRFSGAPDEWVVVEQVDRAIALAERLVGRPRGAVGLRHVSDAFWLPSYGRAPAARSEGAEFGRGAAGHQQSGDEGLHRRPGVSLLGCLVLGRQK